MNPLKLYSPVKPFSINQKFGQNPQIYAQFNMKGHNGLDLMSVHGQPVYAAHDGIAYWETDSNQGEGVVIFTTQQYDYKGGQAYWKTVYWHLADYGAEPHYKSPVLDWAQKNRNVGMPVKRGDLVGFADNTGFSSGDHLHFGLKPVKTAVGGPISPEDATDVANYQNLEQLNGYAGAIDPLPYYNGQYANDKKDFLYDMGLYSLSSDVLALQQRLNVPPAISYLPVGIYGPKSIQAVKNFQIKYGINSTGYCGPITRAALNRGWVA